MLAHITIKNYLSVCLIKAGKCMKNNQLHFKTSKKKIALKYIAFRRHL